MSGQLIGDRLAMCPFCSMTGRSEAPCSTRLRQLAGLGYLLACRAAGALLTCLSHLEPNWRRTGQLVRGYLGITDTPEKGVDLSALADTEMYVMTRLPRSRGFKASRAGCADGTYSTTTYRVGGHTLGWDPRQGPRLTPTAVKRVECTWGHVGCTRGARSGTLLSGVRLKKKNYVLWLDSAEGARNSTLLHRCAF